MVRPRKIKVVDFEPGVTYFKPRIVPLSSLGEVELTVDELETMRLSNLEKMCQEEAAKKMCIHQSTFQRTLSRAREKISDALVNGKAIKIQGGDYTMPGGDGMGPAGNGTGPRGFGSGGSVNRGVGRGRMGGPFAGGPTGVCICTKCGYEEAHVRSQPCYQRKCPKCGSIMKRG